MTKKGLRKEIERLDASADKWYQKLVESNEERKTLKEELRQREIPMARKDAQLRHYEECQNVSFESALECLQQAREFNRLSLESKANAHFEIAPLCKRIKLELPEPDYRIQIFAYSDEEGTHVTKNHEDLYRLIFDILEKTGCDIKADPENEGKYIIYKRKTEKEVFQRIIDRDHHIYERQVEQE